KAKGLIHILAHTLIRMGRLEEAEQDLIEALRINPRSVGAWHELSTLRRMTPTDRPFIEQMAAELQAGGFTTHERAMLHFALGKMHDDLREFEAAIGHYDAANRVRAGANVLDRQRHIRTIDRVIELYPGGEIRTDDALGSRGERAVLIVGMPRSGTTLV